MIRIQRPPVKRLTVVEIDGVKMTRVKAIRMYSGKVSRSVIFTRLRNRPVCTSEWLQQPTRTGAKVTIDGKEMTPSQAVRRYRCGISEAVMFARLKAEPVCSSEWLQRRIKIQGPYLVTIDGEQMAITDALARYVSPDVSERAMRSRLMRHSVCTSAELMRKPRSWVYGRIVDEADAWTLNGKRMPSGHACKWLARISLQGRVRVYKDGTDIRTRRDDGSPPDGYEVIICGATADEIRDMLT